MYLIDLETKLALVRAQGADDYNEVELETRTVHHYGNNDTEEETDVRPVSSVTFTRECCRPVVRMD